MSKPLFETKTLNFSELLGNSKTYIVPRFQRSYSWTEENLEDLWQDILALRNKEEDIHYLGTIVFQTKDNKRYTIIDGQQRIATFSIVIIGCLKLLEDIINKNNSKDDRERKEIIINQYIGFKDPKSLTYESKLTLSETDKDIYNSYIVQLKQPLNLSRLPESNRLLIKAFEYFYKKLRELDLKNGEEIVDFIETISTRIFCIQIVVDDIVSAYTVFETLNARGVELTTTDLLKNFIFSLLDNEIDINNIQPRWDRIVNTVSYSKFPNFLRYYLNSKQKLVRNERLFREIKGKFSKREDVLNLIDELERYSDVYVAFDEPENELWEGEDEIRNLLQELALYGVEQHKSLLLTVYFKMSSHFESVLRIIRAISFRYNVIGKYNPNALERAYNDAAVKIYNGKITSPRELQEELLSVYVGDEEFKNIFSTKVFDTRKSRNRKIVKYILLSLENQIFNKSYYPYETDATIEHIYPENYMGEDIQLDEGSIYRLGNMTLLEPKLNRECANKSFNAKKKLYSNSRFELTKKLSELEDDTWDIGKIRAQQQELARIATSIWKLPFSK